MIIRRTEPFYFRNVSESFTVKELSCKCGICLDQVIDVYLVCKLQNLRDSIGKPVMITSAYRCERHNKSVGGSPNSQHLVGKAADIYVTGMEPVELAKIAYLQGFKGIGVAQGFVHIDTRQSDLVKLWVYPGVDLQAAAVTIKGGGT